MNEIPGKPLRLRHVMDVDTIRNDQDALRAFEGLVAYCVINDFIENISFDGPTKGPQQVIHLLLHLLMDHVVVLCCYGDPHIPSEWRIEPGPEFDGDAVLPLDISMN